MLGWTQEKPPDEEAKSYFGNSEWRSLDIGGTTYYSDRTFSSYNAIDSDEEILVSRSKVD